MASLAKQLRGAASEKRETEKPTWSLTKYCFLKQVELVSSVARFVTVCCTRRAGKSFAAIGAILECCLVDGRDALYVASTIDQARAILWRDLKAEAEKHGGVPSEQDNSITFANGTIVRLRGLSDIRQGGRIGRGVKYGLVIVDETQEIGSEELESFCTEDVKAALVGVNGQANGRIWLMGTPSEFKAGYWYKQHHHPGLLHFEWTGLDNPHMCDAFVKARDEEIALYGINDPRVRREWFNEWVASSSKLILPSFTRGKNEWESLPSNDNSQAITASVGVDLGFGKDPTAIAVVASYKGVPGYFIVFEKRLSNPTFDEIEAEIMALIALWPIGKIYIDPANGGRGFADTYAARHGWPIEAAQKYAKESRLRILDSLHATGRLFAPKDGLYVEEAETVIWDPKEFEAGKKVVSKETPNDVTDAVQYALCDDELLALEGVAAKEEVPSPHDDDPQLREELDRLRAEELDPFKDPLDAVA